jgi:hypothetical protein
MYLHDTVYEEHVTGGFLSFALFHNTSKGSHTNWGGEHDTNGIQSRIVKFFISWDYSVTSGSDPWLGQVHLYLSSFPDRIVVAAFVQFDLTNKYLLFSLILMIT